MAHRSHMPSLGHPLPCSRCAGGQACARHRALPPPSQARPTQQRLWCSHVLVKGAANVLKRPRITVLLLIALVVLAACATGSPPSGQDPTSVPAGGGGTTPPARSTGPVLFLNDLPGICNDNSKAPGIAWTCSRPCVDTPPPAGFSVGNDGDQPLAWSGSVTAPLRLRPSSGVVAPLSRVGQRVIITPPTNAVYQITLRAAEQVATIQVNCS